MCKGVREKLIQKEKIVEIGYETITVADCDFFMGKFKRAILALNRGLQIKRTGSTSDENKERESILSRIGKYVVGNIELREKIADSLYNF